MIAFEARPLWLRLALAAVIGAVAALGLAPWGAWPLTLLGLAVLPALLTAAATPWQAAMLGWAFGAGYFLRALTWLVEPFFVDPDRYAWMAPFALGLMAGGLALFWSAAFWGAHRFGRTAGGRLWLLAVALGLAELARAYLFTGFPWAGLAQVWVDTPVAQLLAWIGPHGLGLATLVVGLAMGHAVALRRGARAVIFGLCPALGLALGALAVAGARPEPVTTDKTVRLVQPNARQDRKWDPEWIPVFFRRQLDYTAAAPRPDLIVWPESAVPVLLEEAGPAFEAIARAARGVPVAVGIQRTEGARFYNSLAVLDETGAVAGVYDKHHLVPFGEYVPFGDLAARFGLRGLAAQLGNGYSAGPGPRLLRIGALGTALPLICYEAVFAQDVQAAPERPDFLLQVTNDGWFGTNSGPWQHLAQARMRAIEQGLPMVRVANTGISAMIDPLGRITASLALGRAGYLDAALPAPLPPTLYARTGDWTALAVMLTAMIGVMLLQQFRHARRK
ncbi:apolipoprotein N-acyltransferase [Jhaorihella thermophila]|uniref:Apolipoprotein N-acyltransferase n=1 Tax=Jhaorihella thermophila TaxID=488547 RepID=A0A1H5TVG2_9RHOB|nr:apolipoprotein N-acyltransferase [Jhaorihella thermophila]SEF66031.1 apolipoprotein N-acyltransferase [Jhaorihella thermophila]